MNKDLILVHSHHILTDILDGLPNEALPESLKTRDQREPGRKQKMLYERKLARLTKQHFNYQKGQIRQWLELWNPTRKAEKPKLPPEWWIDDLFEAALIVLFSNAYLHGVNLMADQTLIGMEVAAFNEPALAWAKQHAGELIKQIDATTQKAVQEAVGAFIETPGMTIGEVVDLLPFDTKRSWRVAVTEITNAYGQSTVEAGKELQKQYPDVTVVKTWFTNNDDLVCEICGPLNGVEIPVGQQFPGGYDGPAAHVNCRCWTQTRTRI